MALNEIRERMNSLNDEMLALFMERMKLSEAIAAYKKEHNLPILDKTREREILAEMIQKGGAEYETYIYQFFNTLMNLSKARQNEVLTSDSKVRAVVQKMIDNEESVFPKSGLVACQGVEGANSQEACDRLFPHGNILYVNTFEAVFQAVQSGLCKFGVLPIENSANGSVRSVYELLQKYHFYVVRSTRQWIHHTLLVKPGTKLSDIRTIYSHQQAIGQCSQWLEKMKGVNVVPAGNTAIAAKMVAEGSGKDCAAIASPRCAELYGLEILEDKIQDSEHCRRDEYVPLLILGNCIYYLGYKERSGTVSDGHQYEPQHPVAVGICYLEFDVDHDGQYEHLDDQGKQTSDGLLLHEDGRDERDRKSQKNEYQYPIFIYVIRCTHSVTAEYNIIFS